jgi:hypothetical protein
MGMDFEQTLYGQGVRLPHGCEHFKLMLLKNVFQENYDVAYPGEKGPIVN